MIDNLNRLLTMKNNLGKKKNNRISSKLKRRIFNNISLHVKGQAKQVEWIEL